MTSISSRDGERGSNNCKQTEGLRLQELAVAAGMPAGLNGLFR